MSIPLLYSVIAHEVAHGWIAYLFGDDTARRSGRLSLNPIQHLDPMGTIALFLVGFGWAKPVPVNYSRLKNSRLAIISVSLAGCFVNILLATFALMLLTIKSINSNHLFATILFVVARINIILGSLNLIPIPPLDGSRVLMAFLPLTVQRKLSQVEPYGFIILVVLLFTGLLNPVINFMQNIILFFIRLLTGF